MLQPDGNANHQLVAQVIPRCRHRVRSLLMIGSAAEGHANASSDIDLIAVVPETGRRLRTAEHGFHLNDRPVSVTYVTEGSLRRRLKRLDAIYQAGGHITEGVVTRIANAVVLFDPDGVGEHSSGLLFAG